MSLSLYHSCPSESDQRNWQNKIQGKHIHFFKLSKIIFQYLLDETTFSRVGKPQIFKNLDWILHNISLNILAIYPKPLKCVGIKRPPDIVESINSGATPSISSDSHTRFQCVKFCDCERTWLYLGHLWKLHLCQVLDLADWEWRYEVQDWEWCSEVQDKTYSYILEKVMEEVSIWFRVTHVILTMHTFWDVFSKWIV